LTKLLLSAWKVATLPSGHLSKFTDFILVMWTPRERCWPEHLRQTKVPKVMEAHLGVLPAQSAHVEFTGFLSIVSSKVIYFLSA